MVEVNNTGQMDHFMKVKNYKNINKKKNIKRILEKQYGKWKGKINSCRWRCL
jgi:hypothetical protein